MRNIFSKPGLVGAAALTVVVGAVLLFVTWQIATRPVPPQAAALSGDVDFLGAELQAVKQRLDQLQARQAVLEREAGVLREANSMLREQESARQAELTALHSELDFYRRLAGTGGTRSGLDVYRAGLAPTRSVRVFQFELTLTQNIQRASIISGQVRISVEGTRDDRPETLDWSRLTGAGEAEPAFRFKYFQQLDGYLTLPEGFAPLHLVVTLEAKDHRGTVQRSYAWQELLAGGPIDLPRE